MKKKGFTLIELITVVIIIAILAALAIPQYLRVMEKTRGAEAKEGIGYIRKFAISWYNEGGNTPTDPDILAQTGLPNACALTHFFQYNVGGSASAFTITATRCEASGKGPNAPGGEGYFVQLLTDLTTGGATSSTSTPDAWTMSPIYGQ